MADLEVGQLLERTAAWAAAACGGYLAIWAAVRLRAPSARRRARGLAPHDRLLSLLGMAVAVAAPSGASAGAPSARPEFRFSVSSPPPWSEPDGFSPPRPSGRTRRSIDSTPAARPWSGSTSQPIPSPSGRTGAPAGAEGKDLPVHEVRAGECLWEIAAAVLGTDDVRRIARYWPRIHRANREVVPNPNLVFPGQRLVLPPEEAGS